MAEKAQPKPTIWCLFSVDNNYDQPDNNLVRWWSQRPTIEQLATFLAYPLDKCTDEQVVAVVGIWKGEQQQLIRGHTAYRLQEVAEGESP